MTVLFFDGFDLSNTESSGLIISVDDYSGHWDIPGTITQASYVNGHNSPRALQPNMQGATAFDWIRYQETYPEVAASGQYRFGGYVRSSVIGSGLIPGNPTPIFGFHPDGGANYTIEFTPDDNNEEFAVRLASISTDDFTIARTTIANGVGPIEFPVDTWIPFEIFVDLTNGTVEFWWNGVINLMASGLSTTSSGLVRATIYSMQAAGGLNGRNIALDDFWLTDGENLRATGSNHYHAVAVAASTHIELGGGGFTGFIVAPDKYDADRQAGLAAEGFGSPPQYMMAHYWFFPDHPVSGAWTPELFEAIDYFGVCHSILGGPSTSHLINLGLGLLRNNAQSFPIVQYYKPTGSTIFSGPWQKTNEALSFVSHVNGHPRKAFVDGEVVNGPEDWLTINTNGCIQFEWGELSFGQIGLAFAQEYDADFRDWATITGGVDYESYFITGYKINGEGDKKQQSNYVTINYEPQPFGSAFFQGIWDYANNPNTGRWSTRQQVVRTDSSDYNHNMRKLKVRGSGRVLQFRVTSERGRPFAINGWTVLTTVGQTV